MKISQITPRTPAPGLKDEIETLADVQRVTVGTEDAMQQLVVHGSPDFDIGNYLRDKVPDGEIVSLVVRDPTLEEAYLSILN